MSIYDDVKLHSEASTLIAKAIDFYWLLDEAMKNMLTRSEYIIYLKTCSEMSAEQYKHETKFIVTTDDVREMTFINAE